MFLLGELSSSKMGGGRLGSDRAKAAWNPANPVLTVFSNYVGAKDQLA